MDFPADVFKLEGCVSSDTPNGLASRWPASWPSVLYSPLQVIDLPKTTPPLMPSGWLSKTWPWTGTIPACWKPVA
jgi:hypothetical protein